MIHHLHGKPDEKIPDYVESIEVRGTAVVEQASDFETEETDQQYSRSPVIIEVFKR